MKNYFTFKHLTVPFTSIVVMEYSQVLGVMTVLTVDGGRIIVDNGPACVQIHNDYVCWLDRQIASKERDDEVREQFSALMDLLGNNVDVRGALVIATRPEVY